MTVGVGHAPDSIRGPGMTYYKSVARLSYTENLTTFK